MTARHFAVAVDGQRITYECPAGHRYTVDHGKGPRHKQIPAWWCRRMLTYWGRENGGVSVSKPCAKCAKA